MSEPVAAHPKRGPSPITTPDIGPHPHGAIPELKRLDRKERIARAEEMAAARTLLASGDADGAEKAFLAIAKRYGPSGDELVAAGRSALTAHREDAARREFDEGIAALEASTTGRATTSFQRPLGDIARLSVNDHDPIQWIHGSHELGTFDERGAAIVDTSDGLRETRRAVIRWSESDARIDPLGRFVAVTSVALGAHGRVTFFSLEDGQESGVLRSGDDSITALAFQPDGEKLVLGTVDGAIRVFDVATFALLGSPKSLDSHAISGIAMNDAGQIAVRSYDGAALLSEKGSIVARRNGKFDDVAFSEGGRFAAFAGRTLEVFSAADGKALASVDDGTLGWRSVAISSDGETLAAGSDQATIQIWTKRKGTYEKTHKIIVDDVVTALAFSPDGRTLAATVQMPWSIARPHRLALFDVPTYAATREAYLAPSPISAIATSSTGMVATALADRSIRIWDPLTGHESTRIDLPSLATEVAFFPDGKSLAAACRDGHARIYDTTHGQIVLDVVTGAAPLLTMAVSPKGDLLATGGDDRTVRLFDFPAGTRRATHGGFAAFTSVTFDAAGERVIAVNEKQVLAFSIASGKSAPIRASTPRVISRIDFIASGNGIEENASPEKRIMAQLSPADYTSSELLASTAGGSIVAGRYRATYLQWGIAVWARGDRKEPWVSRMHTTVERPVLDVALTADGKRIVASTDDGAAHVIDASNGEELYARVVEPGSPGAALVAPDGRFELVDRSSAASLSCAIGAYRFPIDVCVPRLSTTHLVAQRLAHR